MESVFLQAFRINYKDVFGTVLVHDLKENGETILVNQSSKEVREHFDVNFIHIPYLSVTKLAHSRICQKISGEIT